MKAGAHEMRAMAAEENGTCQPPKQHFWNALPEWSTETIAERETDVST